MGTHAATPIRQDRIRPPAADQFVNRPEVARRLALLADYAEQIILASAKVNALRGRSYLGSAVVGLIQVEAVRASIQ